MLKPLAQDPVVDLVESSRYIEFHQGSAPAFASSSPDVVHNPQQRNSWLSIVTLRLFSVGPTVCCSCCAHFCVFKVTKLNLTKQSFNRQLWSSSLMSSLSSPQCKSWQINCLLFCYLSAFNLCVSSFVKCTCSVMFPQRNDTGDWVKR